MSNTTTRGAVSAAAPRWSEQDEMAHIEDDIRTGEGTMAIEKPLNKRGPEIADEVMPDYTKLSKADLIEICFSFARMTYGEGLSDKALMAKVKREHEALKRSQGR